MPRKLKNTFIIFFSNALPKIFFKPFIVFNGLINNSHEFAGFLPGLYILEFSYFYKMYKQVTCVFWGSFIFVVLIEFIGPGEIDIG